eukprot:TRINITY_DN1902_c0_g1_i3.p1 TRINITY_DN1902_c0_g1~~TRINITY_DN1902_c0_g1_i3.p1  ORF type:complete len:452 (-),score=79.29 TRINITY_DN1902_c0_g1_i3:297-1652(-)
MSSTGLYHGAIFFLVVAVAVFYLNSDDVINNEGMSKQQIFSSLHSTVTKSKPAYHNVAVGYNSCLDLIVKGQNVLAQLNSKFHQSVLHDVITSVDHLFETFAYSFENGAAVERFISEPQVCEAVMEAAKSLDKKVYFVGGNAALMGVGFVKNGANVLLGGAVGETSKSHLPNGFTIAKSNYNKDEIHLIMEFKRGETIEVTNDDNTKKTLTAPRDNRLIVHCDYTNSRLLVLDDFHSAVLSNPTIDLVVLSGLHLLEGESQEFRSETLDKVVNQIENFQKQSPSVPIHLELASVATSDFARKLESTLFSHVNSIGLNEQELGFLYYSLNNIEDSLIQQKVNENFKDPTVETVVNAINYIFNHLNEKPQSKALLSRIHFHYLKYHIVAQKKGSGWESNLSLTSQSSSPSGWVSVSAGVLAAALQSCEFSVTEDDAEDKFMLLFSKVFTPYLR